VIAQNTSPMTDLRVLAALAEAMGRPLGIRTARSALAEFDELGAWEGRRVTMAEVAPAPVANGPVLASWRELIDGSRSNDGESALQATARPVVARTSPATAAAVGLADGDPISVEVGGGWLVLPLQVTPTMVDDCVWLPANPPGTPLSELAALAGDPVAVSVANLEGGAA
jgi:NADH-quinone oxidoreductase subunit G